MNIAAMNNQRQKTKDLPAAIYPVVTDADLRAYLGVVSQNCTNSMVRTGELPQSYMAHIPLHLYRPIGLKPKGVGQNRAKVVYNYVEIEAWMFERGLRPDDHLLSAADVMDILRLTVHKLQWLTDNAIIDKPISISGNGKRFWTMRYISEYRKTADFKLFRKNWRRLSRRIQHGPCTCGRL